MTETIPSPLVGRLPAPAEDPGSWSCPECHRGVSEFSRTPSGLCLACSDRLNVGAVAESFSDPFWLLTPREIVRAEKEIKRLAAEAQRLDRRIRTSELDENSPRYAALVDRFFEVERERHLLQLLHAASRQYRRR